MSQVVVDDIVYKYSDGTLALKNISLCINPGESIALIGPNGAGKSSFLQHLNGVLLPATGKVLINGIAVNKSNLTKIRTLVGMIFQNPDDQIFMPTVHEDVAFALENLAYPVAEIQLKVDSILTELNISRLKNKSPLKLSGGEKRLVTIAGVLIHEPAIIAMDEPTANLDPKAKKEFEKLYAKLPGTKILATHDLNLAQNLCPRTILLNKGQLIFDGKTSDIMNNKELLIANDLM